MSVFYHGRAAMTGQRIDQPRELAFWTAHPSTLEGLGRARGLSRREMAGFHPFLVNSAPTRREEGIIGDLELDSLLLFK